MDDLNHPRDPQSDRGPGGDPPSLSEQVAIRKAIGDRWQIPERYRQELYAVLVRVALGPGSSSRSKISAVKTLVAMDRVNLDWARHQAGEGTDAADYEVELAPPEATPIDLD